MTDTMIPWGPSGKVVFDRTYSRPRPDGTKETWPQTCDRVVTGNLGLVYGPKTEWTEAVWHEYDRLLKYMLIFAIIPAGRHLWASGVKGRQYLFNCHHSGWTNELSRHFAFQMERLFEGGGVGANYSMKNIGEHRILHRLNVHIVCDPEHEDYQDMKDAGLLSTEFDADWPGSWDVEDTREGWSAAAVELIDTYVKDVVLHEDRVFDVSRVRKKGSRLKSSGGTASGPLPLAQLLTTIGQVLNRTFEEGKYLGLVTGIDCMEIDHEAAAAVVAGGTRRSARMSVMHWLDPYILSFLQCKQDSSKHWTTNISVEIDREFIDALNNPDHKGHDWAKVVHEQVVKGMLTNGEPGYWNSTLSNVGEVDEVTCTNPCGEIALVEFENCNLGHVNLDAFAPARKGAPPNRLGLDEAHMLMTRFLMRATFGDVNDEEQARLLVRNRRIGVGHLGVQGYLAKRGIRYSNAPRKHMGGTDFPRELRDLYEVVRRVARDYAFELRITEPIKVTTVAPTGSIAKLPGVTEGLHPVLFRFYLQGIRFNQTDHEQNITIHEAQMSGFNVEVCQYDSTGNTYFVQYPTKHQLVAEVEAMGYPADIVEIASEIPLDKMLAFQAMYQENYADNAVSFTANVTAEPHQQEHMMADPFGLEPMPAPSAERLAEVMETVRDALPHLKGTTLMLDGARPQSPYTAISEADFELYQLTSVGDGTDIDCATGACPVR